MILIDLFVETEESKALNDAEIPCTIDILDVEEGIIDEFVCILPLRDESGNKYSKIIVYDELVLYSPLSPKDIYKKINENNVLWQRKN